MAPLSPKLKCPAHFSLWQSWSPIFILVDVYSTADDAIDGENYSLIRPSLIRQLKGILDQYPDDGHILKVSATLDKLYLKNIG